MGKTTPIKFTDMPESRKLKIAFCWYFDKAQMVFPNWRDGLRAAMELIDKKHEVDWIIGQQVPEDKYDFILFWDDSNSRLFKELANHKCRKGICLTTDPHNIDNLRTIDVVYCESQPIFDAVRRQGIRAIKAFGTDTDFFIPDHNVSKDIKYFYPATFSPWKRQSEIAKYGKDLLCVGTVQPDGVEELRACVDAGVKVETGYFPVEVILDYYQRSQNVIIPAVHGSERTVLEAMSCNILPIVTNPEINKRTASYIEEYVAWRGNTKKTPREFVYENYSHVTYAKQLLKGIEND